MWGNEPLGADKDVNNPAREINYVEPEEEENDETEEEFEDN